MVGGPALARCLAIVGPYLGSEVVDFAYFGCGAITGHYYGLEAVDCPIMDVGHIWALFRIVGPKFGPISDLRW